MLRELLTLQERLAPHLLANYYSFISPVNQDLLERFIRAVNNIAPVVGFNRSLHDVLSNQEAVLETLSMLPVSEPLRIYVVNAVQRHILIHDTVEGYCAKNHIQFPNN